MNDLGRLLILAGLGLVALGGLFLLLNRLPGLGLGQLPGDFSWEGENTKIYVPLGTMLLLSLVLTVLVNILLRLFR